MIAHGQALRTKHKYTFRVNFSRQPCLLKTSLLRKLQGRPSPAEAPPIGQIHPYSKIALIFEPLKGF